MKLSKRQKEILVLLEQGLTNPEIASHFEISEHTVKVHLWRLYKRIDVHTRGQAVVWYRKSRAAKNKGLEESATFLLMEAVSIAQTALFGSAKLQKEFQEIVKLQQKANALLGLVAT